MHAGMSKHSIVVQIHSFTSAMNHRYLQMYGHWERAARLAKSILDPREATEVIARWADYLMSPTVGQKVLRCQLNHIQSITYVCLNFTVSRASGAAFDWSVPPRPATPVNHGLPEPCRALCRGVH